MSRLLYINSSPRGERSYSNRLSDAFLAEYRESHRQDEVAFVDVFTKDLPTFDGLALQAKYSILHGQKHSPEELDAWTAVENVIKEFKSADKYLVSAPMWNFGIPYRLKQYLDILVQPGYTFSFSPEEGYKGLVTGKPLCLALARGGEYATGTPAESYDLQKSYLQVIFGFMGFTEIKTIVVEPTLARGPETAQQKLQTAVEQARKLAQTF